jgi:predicted dehydrogenase
MATARIGIIGLGVGSWHLKSFQQTARAEVVALCDAREDHLKKVGKEAGVSKLCPDIGSMLALRDVDAVSVCLPNYLHAEVAVAAMRAGKHVLCEKPLAATADDARTIVRAEKETGKTCMVAMKFRFLPESHYIAEALKQGAFGDVYYGYTHYLRPLGGIPTGAGNWFITQAKSGGGALIDNGVHLLDINWYLMGCPKPVRAFGAAYAKFGPTIEAIKDRFDVEDFGCGLIKFENGASIYLDNAWASMVAETVMALKVLGTKGGAGLWPFSIVSCDNGKNTAAQPDLTGRKYPTQFEHFVACVLDGAECLSPARQGWQLLKMLEAIYASSKTGGAVDIGEG